MGDAISPFDTSGSRHDGSPTRKETTSRDAVAVVRRRICGRRALICCALVSLVALLPGHATAGSGIGAVRICTDCATRGGNLARYDYVVLHGWEAWRIPELKRANPRIRLLLYKNASMTVSYAVRDGRDYQSPAGVGYVEADRGHPEWFLRDTSGRRIESGAYHDLWLMDVGNPAYQRAWLGNVAAEVARAGWDGVALDDVNTSPDYHAGDRTPAAYPTDPAYAGAMRSFLARVGPALRARGKLVLPNIATEWPTGPRYWRDWIRFTSGGILEYWTKWGSSTSEHFTGDGWAYRQQFLALTQKAGKIFLGVTSAPKDDVRSMAYARASFLLDWNGGPSALVFEPSSPEAQDPYDPNWTISIGKPRGPKRLVGGVWRREYTRGIVLVNPGQAAVAVPLRGAFARRGGQIVTSATLAPATGLVLADAPGSASRRRR
jgi:Hypothetical glycosyl hydrolase family 15